MDRPAVLYSAALTNVAGVDTCLWPAHSLLLICHFVPPVLLYRILTQTLHLSSKLLDCRYHKRVWKLV